MSTQNTRISKSRCGMKLPFERADAGDGYAASSEVKTYHMSPEEIAKRYPAQPREKREKPPAFVEGFRQKKREAGEVSRLDIARSKLTREQYMARKQAGKTDIEIMVIYFDADTWGDVLSIMKRQWQFTPAEKLSMRIPPKFNPAVPKSELQEKMEQAAANALVNRLVEADIEKLKADNTPEPTVLEKMQQAALEALVVSVPVNTESIFTADVPIRRTVPVLELIVEIEMLKNRMATDQKRIDYINGVLANTMVEI